MKYPKIPLAQQIIQLCVAKNVQHVILSPGSRNAPLILGFSMHPDVKTYSIVDERCAAFFALGIAQQTGQVTAVVCTSGSALLNYYPAIAEAYYSNIPLLIISADRPKHLINVGDGQTINQENIFEKHILYSANLKQDLKNNSDCVLINSGIPNKLLNIEKEQVDVNQKEINDAINIAFTQRGPVHINAPFAEPLYETQDEFTETIHVIENESENVVIDADAYAEFLKLWNSSSRKMVLVGVNVPHSISDTVINHLANSEDIVVFTETLSNIHHPNFFNSIDQIIAPLSINELDALQPEVLLTFGGMLVSKKVKQFLRTHKPKAHYHIGLNSAQDTFFKLTHHFNVSPNVFFKQLKTSCVPIESIYQSYWLKIKEDRVLKHSGYLKTIPFTDFKAFEIILNKMPEHSILHLSNSSTIRYAQLFDNSATIEQYCNRGTSGIDGSTSTAIGHAVVSSKQHVLITGDLSFLYDSNGLWNNYIPKKFRIILINNSGGGIFRILPGQKHTENFSTYFETNHNLNASHLAKMYGFEYTSTIDDLTLKQHLNDFFKVGEQPKILEVHTPRTVNDEVLIDYFKYLKD